MKKSIRQGLQKYWFMQLALLALLSCLWLFLDALTGLKSALCAGLAFGLPNVYFAVKVFKPSGALQARQIVNAFYKAEGAKLMISALLFAVIFALVKLNAAAFFTTYGLLLTSQWLAPKYVTHR